VNAHCGLILLSLLLSLFLFVSSELEPPTKSGCWKAIGYTDHFSMFAVVARLVEDTVTLDKVSIRTKTLKNRQQYPSVVSFFCLLLKCLKLVLLH